MPLSFSDRKRSVRRLGIFDARSRIPRFKGIRRSAGEVTSRHSSLIVGETDAVGAWGYGDNHDGSHVVVAQHGQFPVSYFPWQTGRAYHLYGALWGGAERGVRLCNLHKDAPEGRTEFKADLLRGVS